MISSSMQVAWCQLHQRRQGRCRIVQAIRMVQHSGKHTCHLYHARLPLHSRRRFQHPNLTGSPSSSPKVRRPRRESASPFSSVVLILIGVIVLSLVANVWVERGGDSAGGECGGEGAGSGRNLWVGENGHCGMRAAAGSSHSNAAYMRSVRVQEGEHPHF